MRKRIIEPERRDVVPGGEDWLNLDGLVDVELTSEDDGHPVEAALLPGGGAGWRAAGPGQQTLRLLFTHPQRLRRIWLDFSETHTERTQEYVLRWSPDRGESFREIVRQQWNFSPEGASRQTEDHHVDLPGVTVLELTISPDISGGSAVASLAQRRLA
jgi:hypothetical protein